MLGTGVGRGEGGGGQKDEKEGGSEDMGLGEARVLATLLNPRLCVGVSRSFSSSPLPSHGVERGLEAREERGPDP